MIYLFGAGGHAKVIIELLELTEARIGGCIDPAKTTGTLFEYPVHREVNEVLTDNSTSFIIAVGNNIVRRNIANKNIVRFVRAISSKANVSARASVGAGTVIMSGVTINTNVVIGEHAILNTNCSVDHDCIVEDYVHISPNAALAGNVEVGEGTHIGIGACVIQGIKIGKWATIGAGTVVINDVPDHAVVVGNPGKIIKYNTPIL